jgi:hopanoid biosynthesis associated RND transporter like protein HpnN
MLRGALIALVAACTRKPWVVIAIAGLLGAAALWYTASHIAIDTNPTKLLPSDLPWRERELAFDAAFPQRMSLIVIVVDGQTPELAEAAAAALTQRLRDDPAQFRRVSRPDGGPFFERNGLLFLPLNQVAQTTESLIAAQPLLGTLAADPSMRGLMEALSLSAQGVVRQEAKLTDLQRALDVLAATLESTIAGQYRPLSWRSLITGQAPGSRELRRFILVQPALDFESIQPGGRATRAIRNIASAAGFVPERGVRVRLTGQVPFADEEFATLAHNAGLNTSFTATLIALLLWLALRSVRIIVAVLASLLLGLLFTAAFGLLAIGPFNLISVAFAVLFVGLGVDFAIQYCIRYRAARQVHDDLHRALREAAAGVGIPLALAAAATALGFYAFLPTQYVGVSQLGLIAGTGMLIGLIVTLTLLPALLVLLHPPGEPEPIGYAWLAPLDRYLIDHRRKVLSAAAVLAAIGLALMPLVRFDFNPLHLRNPQSESVSTALDLMRDPQTSPETIDVLAPSLQAAAALADRLAQLPQVLQAITLQSFVPEQQEQKLALISDCALLLDPTLNPEQVSSPPSDAENIAAMSAAASALKQAAGTSTDSAARSARRLAQALETVAAGQPELRKRAHEALIPGLRMTLEQLRAVLKAQPVTLQDLPPDLVRDWFSADGRARVEVYPRNAADNEALRRFVSAVRTIAPDATGAPVSILGSSETIIHAFIEAGIYALLAITVLLAITLRNAKHVLLTLAPLLLAGVLTLACTVFLRLPLNFANIIALPLLFGIGVAFNVYFVMAWRDGATGVLQSSLTRAVLFSALTTASAFGSLWLSAHPGTASMGELLAISLLCTLAAALLFLPALLGPPKAKA